MRTRIRLAVVLFATLAALGGCNDSRSKSSSVAPLATGVLESVTVWDKPVQRPGETGSNNGQNPPPGSRVEVYEQFILITPPNGPTTLTLHGWYTDLKFKRE